MWVPLCQVLSFYVLTRPFQCDLQDVSTPQLVTFFSVLTSPSQCGLQDVSAPCLVIFFLCPDKFLLMWPPESEYPLVGCFLSMS